MRWFLWMLLLWPLAADAQNITMHSAGQVCFNDSGNISCGDSGMSYNKQTDTLNVTVLQQNSVALGTAATKNTGTSGATIPLLNGNNTYSGTSTFSAQMSSTTGLPTIASGACGASTNGAVVANSTNQSGSITIGGSATATCTVVFSATLATIPNACLIQPANAAAALISTTGAYISSVTASQFVITGTLASANYYYFCF